MPKDRTDGQVLSVAIRGIRRLRGKTSAETAEGMNISLRTYQDFEAGKGRLNMDYVYRFCLYIDADPEAVVAAVMIGSPEFAIRCANNKLMRLIMIGVKHLNRLLGDKVAALDVRAIVSNVNRSVQDFADHAGGGDASAWQEEGEADLRRSRPKPGR